MPDALYKLLAKSQITMEDYARDPQAVLDVLDFYGDHQKREVEELDPYADPRPGTSGNTLSPSTLAPYQQTSSASIFDAGTGLGGIGNTSLDSQPSLPQLPTTITPVTTNLQANRPAPSRSLLTTNRPAPPAPRQRTPLQDYTPPSADLRAGNEAQGPSIDHSPKPPGLGTDPPPARKESLTERDRERELLELHLRQRKIQELQLREIQLQQLELRLERGLEREQREKGKRPQIATSKASPATTDPGTSPILRPITLPPVKPLRLAKKTATPAVTVTQPEGDGGIEAAAADRDRKRLGPDGFPKLQNTNNPKGMSSASWSPGSTGSYAKVQFRSAARSGRDCFPIQE